MSVRLRQVTSGYIRLSQFTSEGRDVELDKKHGEKVGLSMIVKLLMGAKLAI